MRESDALRLERALLMIRAEYERTAEAFLRFRSNHEGYAALLEEVDELWDAVKTAHPGDRRAVGIQKEAIQVGAMALRFVLDRTILGEGRP
jgi:hypothetical protein